jgi:hypothetical protein
MSMKLFNGNGPGTFGFVGERKAVALLCLGFYTTYFFLLTMLARTELPEYVPMFVGLLAVYIVAFLAVGAEWFWGRWFATGIGYWGITTAIMAFVKTYSTAILVFGVMHALVVALLYGERMATLFDAKPAWRERWKIDEQGVVRVRKSVTSAASSLPMLIMFALAPRESESLAISGSDFVAILLLGLAVAALVGLLTSRRTWAILTLGAVGIAVLFHSLTSVEQTFAHATGFAPEVPGYMLQVTGVLAGGALLAAMLPFVGPILAHLKRTSR